MLRHERELRSISLEEVARTTRIPIATLRAMEEDRWHELPGDVFARGFLKSYSEALGLDPRPLLSRFDAQSSPNSVAPPVRERERSRKFGVAFAILVLLVLLTLVLSVVLRPRPRTRPVELSGASQLSPSHA